MERLTERDTKLGFVDSNTLPSYVTIYERLQKYENALEDKEIIFTVDLPKKKGVRNICLGEKDFQQKGYQEGWNMCIDEIMENIIDFKG